MNQHVFSSGHLLNKGDCKVWKKGEQTFTWECTDNCPISPANYVNVVEELNARTNELEFSNKNLKMANQKLLVEVELLEDQVFDLIKGKNELKKESKDIQLYYNRKLQEKQTELELLNNKIDDLMSNKGGQEEHSFIEAEFDEYKINCSEFQNRYLILENNLKASQEVERETRSELKLIKTKLENILMKNTEQYLIYKSTQERIEDTIASLNEALVLVNKKMDKQEGEIFHLKQMFCYNDVGDQSLQSSETDLKKLECQTNINEASFLVLETNLEFPKRTSTAIKKRSVKRKRVFSGHKDLRQKSFWDELKVEHPDLALSFTDHSYNEFYKSLNRKSAWNDSEYQASSDENVYEVSKISRHLTQNQDVVNKFQSNFIFNLLITFIVTMTKHIFFLVYCCLIFCLKLPFHFMFLLIGLFLLSHKSIKTKFKPMYSWSLF